MRKKISIPVIFFVFTLISCHETENFSDFTGNEAVYALRSGSVHGLSGMVTFQEKKDNSTLVTVALNKTEEGMRFPVHLHFGSLSKPGAEIAAILNAVVSETGLSTTTISHMADETRVTYKDMLKLEACIKVHLSDVGDARDVLLAGGNIGHLPVDTKGSEAFGVCKSE